MTDVAVIDQPARAPRVYQNVENAVAVLDSASFEHLQRIAVAMASSSLVPDCLRGTTKDNTFIPFPMATVVSNCFLVTEQAVRWNMSPFAVAQCCSIVHGRLMYEGKLVAAVLQSRLGVSLTYEFGRWNPKTETVDLSAEGEDDALGVIVSDSTDPERNVMGSVGTWKRTGTNSPWSPGAFKRQLRYRGAREWARAHEPGVMLGVITEDEMGEMHERRFSNAPAAPRPSLSAGFPDEPPARLEGPRTAAEPEAVEDTGSATEPSEPSQDAPETIDQTTGEITGGKKRAPKAKADPKPRANAAPSAEPPKPTSGSATDASKGSAEASSGQDQPSLPTNDGGEGEQGQGETSKSPDTSDASPASEPTGVNPMVVAMGVIADAASWTAIVTIIKALAVSPEWQGADADSKRAIRLAAWERFVALRDAGQDDTDITKNFSLMRNWLEFGATSPVEIEGLWPVFWRSTAYREAKETDKTAILGLMDSRKKALVAGGAKESAA